MLVSDGFLLNLLNTIPKTLKTTHENTCVQLGLSNNQDQQPRFPTWTEDSRDIPLCLRLGHPLPIRRRHLGAAGSLGKSGWLRHAWLVKLVGRPLNGFRLAFWCTVKATKKGGALKKTQPPTADFSGEAVCFLCRRSATCETTSL